MESRDANSEIGSKISDLETFAQHRSVHDPATTVRATKSRSAWL
jgi:hypothetical protein